MRIVLLGAVGVVHAGTVVELGAPRQCAVLACLALSGGRIVTVDALVDAVWGERPPVSARALVRTYVSRLRGKLGTVIESCEGGYALCGNDIEVDLELFREKLTRGRNLHRQGLEVAAADVLRAALALWHGEALCGVPGPFAVAQRNRLATERQLAMEECWACELALGRGATVLGELADAVEAMPLNERLVGMLMEALCQAGRRSEAVSVYHQVRWRLADELGMDPCRTLQDLLAAVLDDGVERALVS